MLTEKQKRFADCWIASGNATEAALRAGYSKKTAYSIGNENLKKLEIKRYIDETIRAMDEARIADATEVMKYLTSVLRGELQEEVVVVEGCGEGCSNARIICKQVSARDRNRAAEMLAKRYGLQIDKIEMDIKPVVIGGADMLED